MKNVSFTISTKVYILICISIMLLPIQWVISIIIAILIHESFHYFALIVQNVSVYSVSIHGTGVIMKTGDMTLLQELVSTLSGPIGSILLVFLVSYFPRIAICGIIHGLYNLLPVYPLDGGRVVNCIFQLIHPNSRGDELHICTKIIGLLVMVTVLFLAPKYSNTIIMLPLLISLCSAISKTPCKQRMKRVQ